MMWFQRQKQTTMLDGERRGKKIESCSVIPLLSSLLGELLSAAFFLSASLHLIAPCLCLSLQSNPHLTLTLTFLYSPLLSYFALLWFLPSALSFPLALLSAVSKHGTALFSITGAVRPLAVPLFPLEQPWRLARSLYYWNLSTIHIPATTSSSTPLFSEQRWEIGLSPWIIMWWKMHHNCNHIFMVF